LNLTSLPIILWVPYKYVYLSVGQVLDDGLDLLWGAGAAQIVDTYGQVLEAVGKGVVVLICKHRGGYEHCGLLAVDGGLEGCAHGNLGLAESHVTADESVHGAVALHVGLDGLGGGELVWGILIDERCLKFLLQI